MQPIRIVIDGWPVFSAAAASLVMAMFVGVSAGLAIYSLRSPRSRRRPEGRRGAAVGVASAALWLLFAAWWWRDWPPSAVELTDDAVELEYLLSTERIALADVDRVEFKLEEAGRRHERSILRLSSGGRIHTIAQHPEPSGALSKRATRQLFDHLAKRLPPQTVQDVTR